MLKSLLMTSLLSLSFSGFAAPSYEIANHEEAFQTDIDFLEQNPGKIGFTMKWMKPEQWEDSSLKPILNGKEVNAKEVLVAGYDFILDKPISEFLEAATLKKIDVLAELVDVKYTKKSDNLYRSKFAPDWKTNIQSDVQFFFFEGDNLLDQDVIGPFLQGTALSNMSPKFCFIQTNDNFNKYFEHSRMSVCLYDLENGKTLATSYLVSFLQHFRMFYGTVKSETVKTLKKQLLNSPNVLK